MNTDEQKSPSEPGTVPFSRLMSIDALRGFDMFWIVGGDRVARTLGKWLDTPESRRFAEQFEHVKWEGFRFYDLIFPLFLFLVGVVLPFSLKKYQAGDEPKRAAFLRIARRVILLFLLGFIYNNGLQFRFESQRYTGVLQRIAICYGVAALIFLLTKAREQVILFLAILIGYWAVLTYVPSPESRAGDLTMETSLAGYLDRHYLPGKINPGYYGFGDNEGLLSTIPAVATALLGVLAGQWLISNQGRWTKAAGLALIAGGWSLLLLALFYTIIDVVGWRAWSFYFVVIGVNAITIYVASRIIPFSQMSQFLLGGAARLSGSFQPVLLAMGTVAIEWLLLLHLYRNKIFLRV
jgi:predicted acyltransferase